jgi:hypothetical protein
LFPSTAPKLSWLPLTDPVTLPPVRQVEPTTPMAPMSVVPCWAQLSVNVPTAVCGDSLTQVPFQLPVSGPSAVVLLVGVALVVAVVVVAAAVGDGLAAAVSLALGLGLGAVEGVCAQAARPSNRTAADAVLRKVFLTAVPTMGIAPVPEG